jgi:hypothetical protein
VDDLFGVKFVGPSGRYKAGALAADQKAKLPPDAIAVVQQLVLWFPEDTRLLWLLGELYNADGNLEAASKTLDLCVWSRHFQSATLREHRRIVREALDAQPKPEEGATAPVAPPAEKPPLIADTWQVRTAAVGFGLLVLVLGYLQAQQLVLRMTGRKAATFSTRLGSGLLVGMFLGAAGCAGWKLYQRLIPATTESGSTHPEMSLMLLGVCIGLGLAIGLAHHLAVRSLTRGKTAQ